MSDWQTTAKKNGWHSKEEWSKLCNDFRAQQRATKKKIADLERQLADMAKTIATQDEMLLDCNASSKTKESAPKGDEERGEDGKGGTNAHPPIPNSAAAEKPTYQEPSFDEARRIFWEIDEKTGLRKRDEWMFACYYFEQGRKSYYAEIEETAKELAAAWQDMATQNGWQPPKAQQQPRPYKDLVGDAAQVAAEERLGQFASQPCQSEEFLKHMQSIKDDIDKGEVGADEIHPGFLLSNLIRQYLKHHHQSPRPPATEGWTEENVEKVANFGRAMWMNGWCAGKRNEQPDKEKIMRMGKDEIPHIPLSSLSRPAKEEPKNEIVPRGKPSSHGMCCTCEKCTHEPEQPARSEELKLLRPEILSFAGAMEAVMRKHDAKKGDSWKRMGQGELHELFVKECLEAHNGVTSDEFIDVANFCMMIWSNATHTEQPSKKEGRE